MVRRGSTVRVRQRAYVKCPQTGTFALSVRRTRGHNRTHLRYARRTATSCDAFRHWFSRPGRAGRETKALLSTLDRCLRRRDRDPLSRERCSVAQPTSPVQPVERARMQGASATPGSAGRRPRIARRSATRRRCRAGRGVLARQLPTYTPYRLDVTRTLITGANRGLGFEVARQLVAAGHEVWVGERDEARGRQARAARVNRTCTDVVNSI